MSESQVKEEQATWMFHYTSKTEKPRADKVEVSLSYMTTRRVHKTAGSIKQKNGKWSVFYDSEKSFSFRGEFRRKLDAMKYLQQLAGVKSDTLMLQLSGKVGVQN